MNYKCVVANKDLIIKKIIGTAFFIGSRGFALTAKHVIVASEGEKIIAIFSALP